ncbi:SH3-like domain-containing protein [Secundilactobacillus muriivasis]
MKSIVKTILITAISAGSIGLFSMQAHAKTYAKVTKITSNLKVSDNYINFTGTNALYTKAGTLKGAKLVKSTSQLKRLASSKRGLDSFMVLRTATTNRNSVYVKVRSLDNRTTGWIYNGKSTQTKFGSVVYKDKAHTLPAGGVMAYDTKTVSKLNQEEKTSYYRLATPGTATDGTGLIYSTPLEIKSIVWGAPQVNQPNKTTSMPYANDVFIITGAVTRTRQGDRWLTVADLNNPKVMGYLKDGALTKLPAVTAQTGVTINFTDYQTKQVVGTTIVPTGTGAINLYATFGGYQGLPTGYTDDYEKGFDEQMLTAGFTNKVTAEKATAGSILTYQVGKE